jgi:acetyl esterase
MNESPAAPLYRLIGRIRKPESLRELMAACLRSVYMGTPLTADEDAIPKTPAVLLDEVLLETEHINGIRCAVYSPRVRQSNRLPVLFYMHGGGFVIGCSEDTDYVTRRLCHSNHIVVVSINYRLAPETMFPGALTDCTNVVQSVLSASAKFAIDPSCVFFAGDSAGGNLALSLFLNLNEDRDAIKGLVLLAPWLDMAVEQYESYNQLAPQGIVFDAPFIGYSRAAYVTSEQWQNHLASPIHASLSTLPPTLVLVGTADPLLDQSLLLNERAKEQGCKQLEVDVYRDMPHCFYSFPGLFQEEQECFKRIAQFISAVIA